MARKRMISPEFWTDEKIGSLNVEARLLFMGLISNADDEGRLPGNTMLIKSMIFPYDNYTVTKVEDWLLSLCRLNIIKRYKVDGQTYIQIVNFSKHQTINRPTPSKIPVFESSLEESLTTHGGLSEDSLLKEDKLKEDKLKEININIFALWNSFRIIVHKELTSTITTAIEKALKRYSADDIKLAIDRYAQIYHDDKYFFNYKWNLADFLTQGNALPEFLDEGSKWENYPNKRKEDKYVPYTGEPDDDKWEPYTGN